MKALVRHRYGTPAALAVEEVETPTPGDDQVLIRVAAASVNPLDWHVLTGTPWMMRMMSGLRRGRRWPGRWPRAGTAPRRCAR